MGRRIQEDLRNWFNPSHPDGGWKRINSKGEAIGPCAREPGEPKPKCMSNKKRSQLSKSERASAVRTKRKHDPNPDRKGEPIMVSNFGKGRISEEEYEIDPKDNLIESLEILLEKNKPTSPDKWADCVSQAKAKFDVYPSAYANGWAAQCYKRKGGKWKSVNESKMSLVDFVDRTEILGNLSESSRRLIREAKLESGGKDIGKLFGKKGKYAPSKGPKEPSYADRVGIRAGKRTKENILKSFLSNEHPQIHEPTAYERLGLRKDQNKNAKTIRQLAHRIASTYKQIDRMNERRLSMFDFIDKNEIVNEINQVNECKGKESIKPRRTLDENKFVVCADGMMVRIAEEETNKPFKGFVKGKNHPEGGLSRAEAKRQGIHAGVETKREAQRKGGFGNLSDKTQSRRKSFCARMCGMKRRRTSSKTANDPKSKINAALRVWGCRC